MKSIELFELANVANADPDQSGIYMIFCVPNSCVYIGQSKCPSRRFKRHFYELREGKHKNDYLQRCFDKYGSISFVKAVIENCPKEKLDEREEHYITNIEETQLINLATVGEFPAREETRDRIAKISRGRKHSEETRKKISEAMRGRPPTEKVRKINAERLKAHPIGKGRPKGYKPTDETKAKISRANKGRKKSDDIKKKISESKKGNKHSKQTRKKMSESHRAKARGPHGLSQPPI